MMRRIDALVPSIPFLWNYEITLIFCQVALRALRHLPCGKNCGVLESNSPILSVMGLFGWVQVANNISCDKQLVRI